MGVTDPGVPAPRRPATPGDTGTLGTPVPGSPARGRVPMPVPVPVAGGAGRPGGDAATAALAAVVPSAGGDLVPLSRRAAAMMVVRLALTAAVVVDVRLTGDGLGSFSPLLPAGYLLLTGALSLLVLTRSRQLALAGVALSFLVDGVAAQYLHYRLGPDQVAALVVAAFLVAVCLLASFRTGLTVALSQSVLLVVAQKGLASGLFPPAPGAGPAARVSDTGALVAELVALWLVVLITALAGGTSERELRRRRYDAEALQLFATRLHEDETPAAVLRRALRFAVDELDAARALVCVREAGGLRLVDGHGVTPANLRADLRTAPSALLDGCRSAGLPSLALRLRPERDRWLDAVMPAARRLVCLVVDAGPGTDPAWVVMEHGGQRGLRVERRVVATAGQASATASLAFSRALLLEKARVAASTDGLTGLSNRRTFDDALARMAAPGGSGVALVLADVDHFKRVNDEHGHATGDEVLRRVAAALAAGAGPGNVAARYGGEEFAVLMPGADPRDAARTAEDLRRLVQAIGEPVPVSASFGVAAVGAGGDVGRLVASADAALYRSKEAGRNRVTVASPQALATSPSSAAATSP